jgi:signal transduction histidine kinase
LRTPLNNIRLYLGLLDRGRPEKRPTYMATLHRETDMLRGLIEDLLDLSRLEMNKEPPPLLQLDVNELAQTLVSDRDQLVAQSGRSLEAQLTFPVPPVLADRKMLTQLLTNLIANATNYTQPGGLIRVMSDYCETDGLPWVRITVSDNGPGISEEDQQHLFERFYRGEAALRSGAPGTGLGLAICQEIVSRHQGRLTLSSALGIGSEFCVWLPAAEAPASPPA